ncbi:sn-glycerol-1-phosphate dehydrogenase [Caldanaerobius polysaccharolyticus]|uniref:sn-glycerol-1-phosphate dehydrogenase n=1 Tax=Caldanaerobius polysaccharolyticus TaxID=44256 RepID=UPI00047B3C95|nr:sn-glycerol-1-phosphate dehydrogenase [Caldanaerobius polysaccharolyticus]
MNKSIPIKEILVEDGAVKSIAHVMEKVGVGHSKVMVVCDDNTYKAAGSCVISQLKDGGFDATECVLERDGMLVPDEGALGEILIKMQKDVKFLVAVGSGTINDLVRFISFKTDRPYGIVATAPSMDGYASSVSPLIFKGFKRTYPAVYPVFIIGDVDIISRAPYDMVTAGFGDILGKYTSLADWYISSLVADEAYSEDIASLVKISIEKCVKASRGIVNRDKKAVKELMEALVTSGIAMLQFGNSRPASGAEHHLSHYLEMKEISSGVERHFHGTKVGVMSAIVSAIYHYIFSLAPDEVERLMSNRASQTREEYELRIKSTYGAMADEVLRDLNNFYLDEGKRRQRQDKIRDNWERMKKWVEENVPSGAHIRGILREISAPEMPDEIGVNRQLLGDALLNAKEVRQRYTILRLAEDIGLSTEKILEAVLKH